MKNRIIRSSSCQTEEKEKKVKTHALYGEQYLPSESEHESGVLRGTSQNELFNDDTQTFPKAELQEEGSTNRQTTETQYQPGQGSNNEGHKSPPNLNATRDVVTNFFRLCLGIPKG